MIDPVLLFEQLLNGVQFGMMLYLMAVGLTLTLGIMNLINLSHGSLYMMGAYFAVSLVNATGTMLIALPGALLGAVLLGVLIEIVALRRLYDRAHLHQVLATFGLILFFNEAARIIWGNEPRPLAVPEYLQGQVELLPTLFYPVYRLAITGVAVATAIGLYLFIGRTRTGMRIRAGASNRNMIGALGVNIRLLYTLIFGLGAALAALASIMTSPLLTVQPGMGEPILVLSFVVITIGGIGSLAGSLIAALLVGVVDTYGRVLLPLVLGNTAGPAASAMAIYLLMALVLIFRPRGLVPVQHG
jgi:branched-chain amino acid transport system permease protein